jgi:hypothetical protein
MTRIADNFPAIRAQLASGDLAALRARVAAIVTDFDMPLHESDAGLAEAAERLRQVRARFKALYDEFEIDLKTEAEEIDPYRDALDHRLDDFLIETKPPTLAGAAIMLRHGLGAGDVYFMNGAEDLVENVLELIELGGLPERTGPAIGKEGDATALDPFALGGADLPSPRPAIGMIEHRVMECSTGQIVDPLIALGGESRRLKAAIDAASLRADNGEAKACGEAEALVNDLIIVEDRIAALIPTSAAGAVTLLSYLRDHCRDCDWGKYAEGIADNLTAGIERLAAAAAR